MMGKGPGPAFYSDSDPREKWFQEWEREVDHQFWRLTSFHLDEVGDSPTRALYDQGVKPMDAAHAIQEDMKQGRLG